MPWTVYTKDNCQPCRGTKLALAKRGIEYVEINIDHTPGAREHLIDLGFLASPVVMTGTARWSGYRPDLIESHAKR